MSGVFARAPLRVSLGGGGTDLPSYFTRHGGLVVSAAIDKYVLMLLSTSLKTGLRLKHLEWEEVSEVDDVAHPLLREALRLHWNGGPLELASVSDAPAGTGLGSSGAYTVCALNALAAARGSGWQSPTELAEAACAVEIDRAGRHVGKQDQYAAAHGGVNAFTFNPDGSVIVEPLTLTDDTRAALAERFLAFYSGGERSASRVLADQVSRTVAGDESVERNLHETKEHALASREALEQGDLDAFADLMNRQYATKRERLPAAVTPAIARLRDEVLAAGATGAMLMGAGGGGFVLAYAPDPDSVRNALNESGGVELRFGLDADGATVEAFGR